MYSNVLPVTVCVRPCLVPFMTEIARVHLRVSPECVIAITALQRVARDVDEDSFGSHEFKYTLLGRDKRALATVRDVVIPLIFAMCPAYCPRARLRWCLEFIAKNCDVLVPGGDDEGTSAVLHGFARAWTSLQLRPTQQPLICDPLRTRVSLGSGAGQAPIISHQITDPDTGRVSADQYTFVDGDAE